MTLSWNDIRANAAKFSRDWKDKGYEKGDAQTFYNEFFEVFGASRRRVASFEEPVRGLPENKRGFIDLFWPGMLLVEQKSLGGSLAKAKKQALDYFPGLRDPELPRYVLACNFQQFHLFDLETRQSKRFALAELKDNVHRFAFITGRTTVQCAEQDPVNIKAAQLMGRLHDELLKVGYSGHALERFLVRIVFCMFADSTGIFETKRLFHDYIRNRTSEDGSDLGAKLNELFEVLNTPKRQRQLTLDEDLAEFEYINGDLFAERIAIPSFNRAMRDMLLTAAAFSWEKVSPAIFGALFQSVMDKKKRRSLGAHYTTEKNILKVIRPLFLDALHAEFDTARALPKSRKGTALANLHKKLASLQIFDPACGCGNFLVIAYRELRLLELEILKESSKQRELDVSVLSKIDVDQFHGIELEEFPARIAEIAMWMMDHMMNVRLSDDFGRHFARIPLKAKPNIHVRDALETDWPSVVSPNLCSYIIGNPPFGGSKQSEVTQREQVQRLTALPDSKGTLDYVTGWFMKAGEYLKTSSATVGLVTTNSITQGEQVAQLWPILFDRYGLEITFAHRTFPWGSEVKGKAHVHCVIIGLAKRIEASATRLLYDYATPKSEPAEMKVRAISPYLFDAGQLKNPHTVVSRRAKAPSDRPPMVIGSKPIDGGFYIFTPAEKSAFLTKEPGAEDLFAPFIGSHEFINGEERWLLRLKDVPASKLRSLRHVRDVMTKVQKFRRGELKGKNKRQIKAGSTDGAKLADYPTRFHVEVFPDSPFLVVPETSSEARPYIPIGWVSPPTVPSSLVRVILEATPLLFGLLTSRMHNAWLRFIGGRMKSDPRYSVDIVYNTFSFPKMSAATKKEITKLADRVLSARARHTESSLADMYDPVTMPAALRKAHSALDATVDKAYRTQPFATDRERVEFLLALYEKNAGTALKRTSTEPTTTTRRNKRGKRASTVPPVERMVAD